MADWGYGDICWWRIVVASEADRFFTTSNTAFCCALEDVYDAQYMNMQRCTAGQQFLSELISLWLNSHSQTFNNTFVPMI